MAGLAFGPATENVQRLLADCRVMGPSAIERAAWGWQHYAGPDLDHYERAAHDARQAAARAGLTPAVEAAEQAVRDMTEGHGSTLSWRAEHEGSGRTAEDAALHAALALAVQDSIDHERYRTLVKPISEALPWLLPDEPPDERR